MATFAISLTIGLAGLLLQRLLAPRPKDIVGPRVSDINVPSVSPGNPIIRAWGRIKLPEQMIWTSRLEEHAQVSGGGGGKGGSPEPKQTQYTYTIDAAFAVCRGPIHQFNRIWANQKLLWVNPALAAQEAEDFLSAYYAELSRLYVQEGLPNHNEAYVGAFFFAFNNYSADEFTLGTEAEALAFILAHPGSAADPVIDIPAPNSGEVSALLDKMLSPLNEDQTYAAHKVRYSYLYLYKGDEYQMPNSVLEGHLGVGNVSGFRGTAYFVLEGLQLEDFGNAPPTFQCEIEAQDGEVYVHEIIAEVCQEAGLAEDEFSANSLPIIEVSGFAATSNSSARDVISMLQKVLPFDGAESSFRLYFKWINERPKAILRREDFGAYPDGGNPPQPEESTRLHDFDLPRRLNLKYQEPARNFSINTVYAERQLTESNAVLDEDVSIAMSRQLAQNMVEEQLATRFTFRRGYHVSLPRKYIIIEPGDAVLVPKEDEPNVYDAWRCMQVAVGNDGLLEMQFVDHNYHINFTAAIEDDIDDNEPGEPPLGSRTVPYMLDCPLLTDIEEDNIGYYAVLTGNSNGWTGGALLLDISSGGTAEAFGVPVSVEGSGSNWVTVANGGAKISHGFVTNLISASPAPMVWDYENTVRVFLRNPAMTLFSYTQDDLLIQPLNLCFVGDEIIQFATAEDKGNGVWELSTLLRGLRGTDVYMDMHEVGEKFLMPTTTSIFRIEHDAQYIDIPGTYRAVTAGDVLESAQDFVFTNTGNSLRPRAPQITLAHRDDADDRRLEWLPRARQNGNMISGSTVVLDQPFERYVIDVYQSSVLKATYEIEDDRFWEYTSAAATLDGVTPGSDITVMLYQIGDIIGRGFVAERVF